MRGPRGLLLSALSIMLFVGAMVAHAESWRTITSGWRPNTVAIAEDRIWASSEGGLIEVAADFSDLVILNRDQDLYANDIRVVRASDDGSRLWLAYNNGGLDRYNPATGRVQQRMNDFVESTEVFSIYDLHVSDSTAFVATDIGVSKLTPSAYSDLWIVAETYRNFGSGARAWPQPTKIDVVYATEQQIFVGSEYGIAVASRDDNLFDPDAWTTFAYGTDLPERADVTNRINWIKQAGGEVYAGIYLYAIVRWTGDRWEQVGDNYDFFFSVTQTPGGDVYFGGTGIFKLNETGTDWEQLLPDSLRQKVFDMTWWNGRLVGVLDTDGNNRGGLFQFDPASGDYVVIHPNTPGANQINTIEIAGDGTVWIAAKGEQINGLFNLRDGYWESVTRLDLPNDAFSNTFLDIGWDDAGGVWAGSRGSGLIHVMPTDTGLVPTWYNADESTGARLQAMAPSGFTLVGGVTREPGQGVWLVNTYAAENLSGVLRKPIVHVPLNWYGDSDREWEYFSTLDGVPTNGLRAIGRDHYGRLWLGRFQESNPYTLVMMDPAGTLDATEDDEYITFTTAEIGFAIINDMVIDAEGFLWIATGAGLYYLDTNHEDTFIVGNITGALGEEITAVAIDPMGHVWCGTHNGVSVFNPARMNWLKHYTTLEDQYPSRLVDNDITNLAFHPETGEAWIGTNVGLSVLTTPYRDFGAELGEVEVRPQPFLVGTGDTRLSFVGESLVSGAKVKIFTPSGRLVRELNFSAASSEGWDGRATDGELVNSGVYLLVVTDSQGRSKVGKVAVVRE